MGAFATAIRVARARPDRLRGVLHDRRVLNRAAGCTVIRLSFGQLHLLSPWDVSQLRGVAVSYQYCHRGFIPASGWTIVDVGANLGFFTAWALSFMQTGTILAIEPAPSTFAMQLRNVGPSGTCARPGVEVLCRNLAAGAHRGEMPFVVAEGQSALSHGDRDGRGAHADVERPQDCVVPVLPLDDIVSSEPMLSEVAGIDLLKVDVEGMEADCFGGARTVLDRTLRVVFEYHSNDLLSACATVLCAHGMHERYRLPNQPGADVGTSFWSR